MVFRPLLLRLFWIVRSRGLRGLDDDDDEEGMGLGSDAAAAGGSASLKEYSRCRGCGLAAAREAASYWRVKAWKLVFE